jgi:hypothetical protein
MNLLQRLISRLPIGPQIPVYEPAREADDDSGWLRVPLLPTAPTLDLEDLHGERLLLQARAAHRHNPIAHAIVEQTTSFVLGGGAKVVAEDKRVQQVIDGFWHDHDNRLPQRIYAIHHELAVDGEQFIRFFADPLTGRTVIRQLNPHHITHIHTDPQDHETPLSYEYHDTLIPASEILHLTINKPSYALRGRSDLAPILPWLHKYSKWLDDRVLSNELKSALVWDVTLNNAGLQEINAARAAHATPPKRGSVLFHSDNETWKPINPQINASDASPDGRALRLMIATGALLPEHYLGEGGNANRATAAEMGLPAIKRFQRRQELFRSFLAAIVNRALDEATRVGRLGPRANRTFAVQFEELTTSPLDHLAAAVQSLTTSLNIAAQNNWVTPEEARRLWFRYHSQADESAPQGDTPSQ